MRRSRQCSRTSMDRSFSVVSLLLLVMAVVDAAAPTHDKADSDTRNLLRPGLGVGMEGNADTPMDAVKGYIRMKGIDETAANHNSIDTSKAYSYNKAYSYSKDADVADVGHGAIDTSKAYSYNKAYSYSKSVGVAADDQVDLGPSKAYYYNKAYTYSKSVGVASADHDTMDKGKAYSYSKLHSKHMQDMADKGNFFLEKDLHAGATMKLDLRRKAPAVAFIPQEVANFIPFSTKKLPNILSRFSVQPKTAEARTMEETLQDCERSKHQTEESKYCITSLESMVDYAISALGTSNVRAITSEVGNEGSAVQEFTVASSPIQKQASSSILACHQEPYPYAVFYCHVPKGSWTYMLQLVGEDGAKVGAVAVCHADTATWYPEHPAFQALKVKPGTTICHFIPEDHLVFVPRQ